MVKISLNNGSSVRVNQAYITVKRRILDGSDFIEATLGDKSKVLYNKSGIAGVREVIVENEHTRKG